MAELSKFCHILITHMYLCIFAPQYYCFTAQHKSNQLTFLTQNLYPVWCFIVSNSQWH